MQKQTKEWHSEDYEGEAWDDVTGNILDPKDVKKARIKERKREIGRIERAIA